MRPSTASPPDDLAGLRPEDLRRLGFSRQKGHAMIELARSITEGRFDPDKLAELSDEEAVERLRGLRGVGRWTAEYVLLRGLGRTHVFPGTTWAPATTSSAWLHLAEAARLRRGAAYPGRLAVPRRLIYFHLLLDRLEEAGHLQAKRKSGSPVAAAANRWSMRNPSGPAAAWLLLAGRLTANVGREGQP